jgi:hypothetical protein
MPKGEKCPKYVSGNSLKGSNIKKEKERKIHAAGKKDAGGDDKLLIFFTWPKCSHTQICCFLILVLRLF